MRVDQAQVDLLRLDHDPEEPPRRVGDPDLELDHRPFDAEASEVEEPADVPQPQVDVQLAVGKVTIALLVALGAVEHDRPTTMFLTKEAVRVALDGTAVGVACEGCPPLPELLKRDDAAGDQFMVCPLCFNAKQLDADHLLPNAEVAGTVKLWEWTGDGATTFSL